MSKNILIDMKKIQLEESRLDLLNDIIFFAKMEHWERVEKLKTIYRDVYGTLPGGHTND